MFNKGIYQEWELHQDATQLEIKYKFFVKFVDILNVRSLIKNESNNFQQQITDSSVIKNWQTYQLEKVANEFITISSYKFPETKWFTHNDIFVRSIFMLSDILLTLKTTNYKANELEIYYEPVMFKLAQKILKPEILNEWVSILSERVFSAKTTITEPMNFEITLNEKNINNIMWIVENLCLSFKDITNWYTRLFTVKDVPQGEKAIYVNIMNHMIVYSLSDFYIKLNSFGDNKKTFSDLYEWVLANIAELIKSGKFAIKSFKSIAIFLSKVLLDEYISKNDDIILNFLSIVKVSSSKPNYDKISEMVLGPINAKEAEILKARHEEAEEMKETMERAEELSKKMFGDFSDATSSLSEKTSSLDDDSPFATKTSGLSLNKFKNMNMKTQANVSNELEGSVNKTKDFNEVDEDDDIQTIITKKRSLESKPTGGLKTIKLGENKPLIDQEEWDEIILNTTSDEGEE